MRGVGRNRLRRGAPAIVRLHGLGLRGLGLRGLGLLGLGLLGDGGNEAGRQARELTGGDLDLSLESDVTVGAHPDDDRADRRGHGLSHGRGPHLAAVDHDLCAVDVDLDDEPPDVRADRGERRFERRAMSSDPRIIQRHRITKAIVRVHPVSESLLGQRPLRERPRAAVELVGRAEVFGGRRVVLCATRREPRRHVLFGAGLCLNERSRRRQPQREPNASEPSQHAGILHHRRATFARSRTETIRGPGQTVVFALARELIPSCGVSATVLDLRLSIALSGGAAYDEAQELVLDLPNEAMTQTRMNGQRPQRWLVRRAHFTHELGQLFRCELLLSRREELPQAPPPLDQSMFDKIQNQLDDLKTGNDGIGAAEDALGNNNYGDLSQYNPYDPNGIPRDAINYASSWINYVDRVVDDVGNMYDAVDDAFTDWSSVQEDIFQISSAAPWQPEAPPSPATFMGTFRSLRIARRDSPNGLLLHGRWISGIVTEFEDVQILQDGTRIVRVVIEPRLRLLELRRNHRIFEQLDAIAIIEKIFDEASIYRGAFDYTAVTQTLPKREQCIQYGESDLDFVMRLLSEEGLIATFDMHHNAERIRVAPPEALSMGHQLLALSPDDVPLPNIPNGTPANAQNQELFWGLRVKHALAPTKTAHRAFDFSHRPREPLAGEAVSADGFESGLASAAELSHHDFPSRADFEYDPDSGTQTSSVDLDREAELHLRALRKGTKTWSGRANTVTLLAGQIANVTATTSSATAQYSAPFNPHRRLLITSVESFAEPTNSFPDGWLPPRPMRFGMSQETFAAFITAVEASVPFVPDRIAPPTIDGFQTVVVQSGVQKPEETGDQIGVDALGRVRARFAWDRRGMVNGERAMSYPIRVAEPWAGNGWGTTFLPREDMELVVSFLNGDPERAIALGAVHSFLNRAPRERPHLEIVDKDNHMADESVNGDDQRLHYKKEHSIKQTEEHFINMIRTRTHPAKNGTPKRKFGYHELSFDDTPRKERVRIHSEGQLLETVEEKHQTSVGRDQMNIVQGDQTEEITGDMTLHVIGNRDKRVHGHERERVDGDQTIVVRGQKNLDVEKDQTRTVTENESLAIAKRRMMEVSGHRRTVVDGPEDTRKVGGNAKAKVGGAYELAGNPYSGTALEESGGDSEGAPGMEIDEDGNMTMSGGEDGELNLHAKGDEDEGSVSLDAETISIRGATAVRFECGDVYLELSDAGIEMYAPKTIHFAAGATSLGIVPKSAALHTNMASEATDGNPMTTHFDMKLNDDVTPGVMIQTDSFYVSSGTAVISGDKVIVQEGDDEPYPWLSPEDHEELQGRVAELERRVAEARREVRKAEIKRDTKRIQYRTAASARRAAALAIEIDQGADSELRDAFEELREAERNVQEKNRRVQAAQVALNRARDRGDELRDEQAELDEARQEQQKARQRLDEANQNVEAQKADHADAIRKYEEAKAREERASRELTQAQDELVEKRAELDRLRRELAEARQLAAEANQAPPEAEAEAS